jgi:excisionase family DNA binding protein
MTVTVTLTLNGVQVPVELDDDALAAIAAAVTPQPDTPEPSPYMTIVEAAAYLRCTRQRVDDLLSSRRLPRVKEGARTLIRRTDLDTYLANCGNRRSRR